MLNNLILSLDKDMQPDTDEVLLRLRTAVDPILTEIDNDLKSERAVLMIGAREINHNDGENVGLQTCIDIVGDYGLIQEALYPSYPPIEPISNEIITNFS